MQDDRHPGGAPAHDPRRRGLILLAGIALAAIVTLIAVTQIGSDGEGDGAAPDPPNGDTVEAPDDPVVPAEPPPTTTTRPPPTTTTEPPPPTTTEPPPTTTTEPPPPPPPTTTTTEPPPPPPVALLTPTGIPVTVIEPTEAGYLVLTPCGNTVEVSGGDPIGPVRVVLDPGHGGPVDTGTVGPNGLIERDLNLALSNAIGVELDRRGISSATTRTDDYMVRLRVRVDFADALEGEALVSVHHNGPTWELQDTPGTEIYVQSASTTEARPESARLGGLLYEEITEALGTFDDVQWSGLPDAGVKRVLLPEGIDTYALVRHPDTPSALVEYGYLTNASEADLFATWEYINVAAVATADAIEAFLETDRPGTGFVEEPRIYDPTGLSIECVDPLLEPEPAEPADGSDADAPDEESTGTDDVPPELPGDDGDSN